MIQIVIFDDEEEGVSSARTHVQAYFESIERSDYTVSAAHNLQELDELMSELPTIDVLLADIVFPDSPQDGIETVAQRFPAGCGTEVIYVSGYLEKALEVYETAHVYFLLKPIDDIKLAKAMDIALGSLSKRIPNMLSISYAKKQRLINPASIMYLKSDLRVVTVCCRGGVERRTYSTLDELATQLPSSFCRCHRSYLVNLACVKSLHAETIELTDGTTLPVSRRRAKEVQQALYSFVQAQLRSGRRPCS